MGATVGSAQPAVGSAKLVGVESSFFLRFGDGSVGTTCRFRGTDCRFRLASGKETLIIPWAWSRFQRDPLWVPRSQLSVLPRQSKSKPRFSSGLGTVPQGPFAGSTEPAVGSAWLWLYKEGGP